MASRPLSSASRCRLPLVGGKHESPFAIDDFADGQDLGIEGTEEGIDPNLAKPVLNIELQGGRPLVKWTKQGFDGLEIQVDRGNGFGFLAIDTEPDYLDTAALPAPGQSAIWKYKAIYRLHDEQVGQWSYVVTVAVTG